jgi:single-strand DNA-binding protein
MFEQIILAGRLTADPEMRYTPSGQAVTNFTLAIDDNYTDSTTGTKVERTKFIRCSCWGKVAENVSQYKKKGEPVLIVGSFNGEWVTGADGKLTSNGPKVWNAQDGTPRASYEVTAHSVKFLPSPKPTGAAAAPANVSSSTTDPDASGIPF